MHLSDFTMLGMTSPTKSKKYGRSVCSAGYSVEMRQLLRVYPLSPRNLPSKFGTYEVDLARPSDMRHESWVLSNRDAVSFRDANDFLRPVPSDRDLVVDELLRHDRFWASSVSEANDRRVSLALIDPLSQPDVFVGTNSAGEDVPRVMFEDASGVHKLQWLDKDAVSLLRSRGGSVAGLEKLMPDSPTLLVGNFAAHRSKWLVIAALSLHDHICADA